MITLQPVEITDVVSGLKITIVEGEHQNRIRINRLQSPGEEQETLGRHSAVTNRDFFFQKDGKFDGTGSFLGDKP